LHPRDNTFPGEVLFRLAANALAWCGASRADPLDLEGIRERFLPECTFRGRQNKKLQYAVLVAAALHGGTGQAGERLGLIAGVGDGAGGGLGVRGQPASPVQVTGLGGGGQPGGPAAGRRRTGGVITGR